VGCVLFIKKCQSNKAIANRPADTELTATTVPDIHSQDFSNQQTTGEYGETPTTTVHRTQGGEV